MWQPLYKTGAAPGVSTRGATRPNSGDTPGWREDDCQKKRDGCILSWQLTYRGTRKRIGRGRCTAAFDAAPSVFEREFVRLLWQKKIIMTKKIIVTKKDYCDKKMSKVNKWWQEMCTWHRRTTRRQLGRARVREWSDLGRGGYGARKLGVAFLEEYNVRISSWIAYDRHAQ